MHLMQSYRILGLKPDATLDDVKRAYRRLAFELHPDLHPNTPMAARKFRELNEAYVFLRQHIKEATQTHTQQGVKAESRQASKDESRSESKQETRQESGQAEAPSSDAKAEDSPNQDDIRQQQARRGRATTIPWAEVGPKTVRPDSIPSDRVYYRHEEVMRDILSDPFARQVFEDIFREIDRSIGVFRPESANLPTLHRKRELNLQWGGKNFKLDLTDGVWPAVKSWVRSWMDFEQNVYMNSQQLVPGSKVRVQIKPAFEEKPIVVEITLPQDFAPGRLIRLKGLGRRLGGWQGDLFLRLLAKTA